MKVLIEVGVGTLEIEDESFEIGVAVGHEFDGFFFGFEAITFFDHHS